MCIYVSFLYDILPLNSRAFLRSQVVSVHFLFCSFSLTPLALCFVYKHDVTYGEDSSNVGRIALRLPVFWRNNVALWIRQCDSAFVLSQITQDETKYAALVSMLDPETLSHVSDIILSPPAENKYLTLSYRLIREFADSEHQKKKKLLTELQLGDDKPSHLLRKMKELSGGQLQDEFLKNLWLQHLPSQIQTVFSVSSETLDKLAEIADKVADVSLPVATSAPELNTSAEIQELAKQIVELKLQISRMSRPRNKPFFRRKSSSRSRNRNRTTNHEAICFYHKRYRANARNCVPPCDLHRQSRDRPSSQSEN
ncbi:uncharacterized protein TNIN_351511 [Trichonephila inaurata madagascariensis]|uniref:DUF7041 domain-containing protein n=1 Tax=Trichonephila inaurata madagascariensis TaxID=2747483 RepID=A0A8X6XGZ1_9ARAC|nr:uncharacterized protein TNIN_351511 [Trichonephila inaurata madagascariensis]